MNQAFQHKNLLVPENSVFRPLQNLRNFWAIASSYALAKPSDFGYGSWLRLLVVAIGCGCRLDGNKDFWRAAQPLPNSDTALGRFFNLEH